MRTTRKHRAAQASVSPQAEAAAVELVRSLGYLVLTTATAAPAADRDWYESALTALVHELGGVAVVSEPSLALALHRQLDLSSSRDGADKPLVLIARRTVE